MAIAWIYEFTEFRSKAQIPPGKFLSFQNFTFSAATASAIFQPQTRFIMFKCSVRASYHVDNFVTLVSPIALITHMPMEANDPLFVEVAPGQAISFVANP